MNTWLPPQGRRRPATGIAPRGIPALDGLRAISIGLVLAAHMLPLGPKSLALNEAAGAMGMSLFFTLSGYLVVRTLRTDTVSEFIVKRLARILPLAYLYIFSVFLLSAQSREALLAELGFVLNYRPELIAPFTAHLWSLCVEVHFYAAVALVTAVARKGIVLVWPCCLAITALRVAEGAYIDILTHLRIDEILTGACLATLPAAWLRRVTIPPGGWALAAAFWFAASHPASEWLQYLRPYAAGLLLAATLRQPPNRLAAVLSSGPLRYLAMTSYAIYVIHPLTTLGWWNEGSVWERYLMKRPVSFVIVFAAAHLSTTFWESVWLRAARRWIESRRLVRQPALSHGEKTGECGRREPNTSLPHRDAALDCDGSVRDRCC